jgi:hypothetical protein
MGAFAGFFLAWIATAALMLGETKGRPLGIELYRWTLDGTFIGAAFGGGISAMSRAVALLIDHAHSRSSQSQ